MIDYLKYKQFVLALRNIQEHSSKLGFYKDAKFFLEEYKNDFPDFDKFLIYFMSFGDDVLLDYHFFTNHVLNERLI